MEYFSSLPKVAIFDEMGQYQIMTNLMTRAALIEKLENSSLLFYTYDVQESDTPEIVAHKYYGDSYRYWIILHVNKMMDPFWDWPLPERELNLYIDNKYMPDANNPVEGAGLNSAQANIYEYRISTKTTDNNSLNVSTEIVSCNANVYASTITGDTDYTIPGGYTCTVSISKYYISQYEKEVELNEAKRSIKLLNESYVSDFETQFRRAMSG